MTPPKKKIWAILVTATFFTFSKQLRTQFASKWYQNVYTYKSCKNNFDRLSFSQKYVRVFSAGIIKICLFLLFLHCFILKQYKNRKHERILIIPAVKTRTYFWEKEKLSKLLLHVSRVQTYCHILILFGSKLGA